MLDYQVGKKKKRADLQIDIVLTIRQALIYWFIYSWFRGLWFQGALSPIGHGLYVILDTLFVVFVFWGFYLVHKIRKDSLDYSIRHGWALLGTLLTIAVFEIVFVEHDWKTSLQVIRALFR